MNWTAKKILVVDDDALLGRLFSRVLENAGYETDHALNGETALELLAHEAKSYSAVLLDLKMPGLSGLELLEKMISRHAELAIVVMTAFGTVETAVKALKLGALDFLTKPLQKERILLTVERACRYQSVLSENQRLKEQLDLQQKFTQITAVSPTMKASLDQALAVAATPSTVLILGESGTGKELLARFIHDHSNAGNGPFHALNIAAIPEGLFEAQLFGHSKGAFTNAAQVRPGAIETAKSGTLFLDEIGDLGLESQVKLLRVLQEREYFRIGEDKARPVQTRIIAATNQNLESKIAAGQFRSDLYYRLCVVPIELPPLRRRKGDIPTLAALFLERAAMRLNRPTPTLSERALAELCDYDFPGNVRELENLMERLVALTREAVIEKCPLPSGSSQVSVGEPSIAARILDLAPEGIDLANLEKSLILEMLERCQGNQTRAAKKLGITRSALIYRLEKYGRK